MTLLHSVRTPAKPRRPAHLHHGEAASTRNEPVRLPSNPATLPLILNLAPTGMVPTRELSPKVPLQPAEIVEDVCHAAKLGITIVHLHARDDSDRPTHRKEVYARIIGGIREHYPDLIICVSCSGRSGPRLEERMDVLDLARDLRPDMASLTTSSLNFTRQASVNSPDVVKALAERMLERDIKPEIEIFDLGMANMVHYLLDRGLLQPPLYANLLFGNLATAQADFLDIGTVIAKLPPGTIWSLAGLGATQLSVAAMAAGAAPGVRIGLEDNLWLDRQREQFAGNADLVDRVHQLAQLVNRTIMTPAHLRTLLGLKQRA